MWQEWIESMCMYSVCHHNFIDVLLHSSSNLFLIVISLGFLFLIVFVILNVLTLSFFTLLSPPLAEVRLALSRWKLFLCVVSNFLDRELLSSSNTPPALHLHSCGSCLSYSWQKCCYNFAFPSASHLLQTSHYVNFLAWGFLLLINHVKPDSTCACSRFLR